MQKPTRGKASHAGAAGAPWWRSVQAPSGGPRAHHWAQAGTSSGAAVQTACLSAWLPEPSPLTAPAPHLAHVWPATLAQPSALIAICASAFWWPTSTLLGMGREESGAAPQTACLSAWLPESLLSPPLFHVWPAAWHISAKFCRQRRSADLMTHPYDAELYMSEGRWYR